MNEILPPFSSNVYGFDVLNPDEKQSHRVVVSPLSVEALQATDVEGYVLLRSWIDLNTVQRFREIVDEILEKRYGESKDDTYGSGRFGGQYIRDLHAHIWEAFPLLVNTGLPDIARSLLGPRIVLRSYSARVCHPASGSSTIWHCDQRARVAPQPCWFTDGMTTTVLVYLDPTDVRTGRTELIPGSHRITSLPSEELDPEATGNVVSIEAGSGDVLVFNGALWHRAGPTGDSLGPRRVLNLQFAPSWAKRAIFEAEGSRPAWTKAAEQAASEGQSDILELLGLGGYM